MEIDHLFLILEEIILVNYISNNRERKCYFHYHYVISHLRKGYFSRMREF